MDRTQPHRRTITHSCTHETNVNNDENCGISKSRNPHDDTSSTNRVCRCCGATKPTDGFYTKGNRTDSRCKSCVLKSKSKSYKERCSKRQKLLAHKPADLTPGCYKIAIFAHEGKGSNLDTIKRNIENFVKESLCSA